MKMTLVINPKKDEYIPERYKAVLLSNDNQGVYKAYPKSMDLEEIIKAATREALIFETKLTVKYNIK